MNARLQLISRYRGFIAGSVQREFQTKYRNSILGAAWTVLNPLAMIVVYTVIFSQVMRSRLPDTNAEFAYSIYLCAGVLSWGLFSEIASRAQTMFIENAGLIKKISFPRICLPIIVVANAGINFGIIFGLFTVFLVLSGNFPGLPYVALVPVYLVMVAFAIGLGIILGVLNVFFRDVGQFFAILLQFWFWFTPVVYPVTVLPEHIRDLLRWNPMAPVIGAAQDILVRHRWPDWSTLWPVALVALLLCMLAMHLFRKRAGEMVDQL
ncbi:ABC transporter permease [Pseudoduganella umbonata]|uniref:Transport permease protein n=1 Tax=Pseudoduganella umbonata TaxID=864828 RepID=A0A4P8HT24_9BURK|nr:ABC transporter permease [Pseudoduganella umbonata]MBB3220859.1 lipopolysaccharide transport system permease protein [Pseudoduganella umbonata]QCP11680.1 ABC transporter permease [Pseudoduganella umbonata]